MALSFKGLHVLFLVYLLAYNPVPFAVYAGTPLETLGGKSGYLQRAEERGADNEDNEVAVIDRSKRFFVPVGTIINMGLFAANSICMAIILADFGCGGWQRTICDLKNQVIVKRNALDKAVEEGSWLQGNYSLNLNDINQIESQNNKITSKMEESIDISTNYLKILENIKKQNINVPDAPKNLLTFDPNLRRDIIEINKDVMKVSGTGLPKEVLIISLVFIGLELLYYAYSLGSAYRSYSNMPDAAKQGNFDFTFQRNGRTYGVLRGANGPEAYRVNTKTGKATQAAPLTDFRLKRPNTVRGVISNVYHRYGATIGTAIAIGLQLAGIGLCIWQITEMFERNAAAESSLRESIANYTRLYTETTESTKNLTVFYNQTLDILNTHMTNFDTLVDILVNSSAFKYVTQNNSTLYAQILDIKNAAVTRDNVANNMKIIVSFLENYRVQLKAAFDQIRMDVQIEINVKSSVAVADILTALKNIPIVDVTAYDVYKRISILNPNMTSYDGVALDCVRNGNIYNQTSLEDYISRQQNTLSQLVINQILTMASGRAYLISIRNKIKSTHGVDLTNDEVLKVIANGDEYKNEAKYPKPDPYYGSTGPTFDLAPYRTTSTSC